MEKDPGIDITKGLLQEAWSSVEGHREHTMLHELLADLLSPMWTLSPGKLSFYETVSVDSGPCEVTEAEAEFIPGYNGDYSVTVVGKTLVQKLTAVFSFP